MAAKKKVINGGLSVEAARTHALEILALADAAVAAGQEIVEGASLVGVLQKLGDVARSDLVAAINEAGGAAK